MNAPRKLTVLEKQALRVLVRRGTLVPGDAILGWSRAGLLGALDGLVRKKRATVEMTDDGPKFSLTALGEADAA